MEMRVFFASPLPAATAVNDVMRQLGLRLAVKDTAAGFSLAGFTPMTFGDGAGAKETGTESYLGAAKETIDELGIQGVNPGLEHEISFRWGSDFMEGACAFALSASIASLTNGVIWDDTTAEIISIEQAVETCREFVAAGNRQ
jgi:hypothetical protein